MFSRYACYNEPFLAEYTVEIPEVLQYLEHGMSDEPLECMIAKKTARDSSSQQIVNVHRIAKRTA